MQKPPEESVTEHVPLALRWQRLRLCYRMLNLASHHVLGFTIKLVLLAYFSFAVLFLFLRYAILPNIDYYKGDIERLASRAVGNPVTISRIYASWKGLRPSLYLADVTLHDAQGHDALDLPSVSATLSWWTLVAGEVRFETLEVVRPDLRIRRARDGKLYVAGLPIDPNAGGDGRGADWLLAQRDIVVREGRLRWTDELRGAPELALDNLSLVLRNQWRRHRFAVRATPPASLGGPIDLRADFTHPAFSKHIADAAQWNGEIYADLPNADLAFGKAYFDYPFALDRGRGALRAWLTLDHAHLAGFTADIGLADVAAQLGADLPAVDLVKVSGRVAAREDLPSVAAGGKAMFGQRGFTASVSNFALQSRDGLTLAPTTLAGHYIAASGARPQSAELKATLIDLQTLSALAARLPLTAAQRQQLDGFAPRGRLLDFSASWEGVFPTVTSYRIKGRVDGLGLKAQPPRLAQAASGNMPAQAAVPATPGFDNLTGSIDATEKSGSITVNAHDFVLQMPDWFSQASMPFETLNLQANWTIERDARQQDQLRLAIDSMDFVQQGLSGTLHGSHLMPLNAPAGKGLGYVDFTGTLNNFDLKTIDRYLPLATPPELRGWLTGALEEGLAKDVSVRLRGDLAQFPFKGENGSRGEFRVAGKLENARLNYAPSEFAAHDPQAPLWPQAANIQGSFLFDHARMEIRGDTAHTGGKLLDNGGIAGGVALSGIKAVIPDLSVHDKLLTIDGNAAGPMPEFVQYVADSPVLEWISRFTDQTRAVGNAKLALHLQLPLAHLPDAKVQGALQLLGTDVTLFDDLPPVLGATGRIEFNEKGVNLNGLNGTFLGGPLAVSGGTQRDMSIQVRIAGALTAEGLHRNYASPVMQRLIGHLNGSARYSGLITERDHQLQIAVDSSLAGLGLDLPAPLKKNATDAMPIRFTMNGGPADASGVAHDDIRIGLGNGVAAHYQRQKQGSRAWRVVRGGIGVNMPAPEPDAGLAVNVNLKTLDVDAWSELSSNIVGSEASTRDESHADDLDIGQYVVPDTIAARSAELVMGERKLENVVLGASHQKGVWQANLDARQASGYVTWSESASGPGKVTARLSSLIIPESDAAEVKDLLEGKSAGAQAIPALDIVAERFELFNKSLGRLELQAYNAQPGSSGREWRMSKLSLANPDGELKGSGKWVIKDGQSNSSLNFSLDIADAGKLLDRLGFADTVSKGKGKLSGDIAWKGLPYSFDIPSLSGQLDMNVENGQFLKQDPGAAKLLGVLSLQALPRLLKLDFHDVFSQGLAFDGISATAQLSRGVLKTDNLKMHGVAATVLMDGSADIANESTNLHVVVIPEFNLGTGPLVYALAVNPVIGLGSFLAQLFLRDPVMRALTYQMQITGPWKSPTVVKISNDKLDTQPLKAD
jgi:uncharacterized protein (TIGR02099 family)